MKIENIKNVLSIVAFAIFLAIGAFIFVDKQNKKMKADELMAQYRSETVESNLNSERKNIADDSVGASGDMQDIKNNENINVANNNEDTQKNNNENIFVPTDTKSVFEKNLREESFYEKILSLKKEETSWENKRYNQMLQDFANDVKENHNCNKFYWNNKSYIHYLLQDARFLGDSNIYHLIRFNILPEKNTRQMRGQSTTLQYDIVNEKIEGSEKNYIFWNGYNIKYFKNADEYAKSYEDLTEKLKSLNENCDVYICSLLPATDRIIEDDLKSDFVHNIYRGLEFDDGLKRRFGDNYIDTKMFLFSEEQYQEDGVHLDMEYAKMLVSYVAFYINRDKKAIEDTKNEEEQRIKEVQDLELLENNKNIYYENNLIKEETIEYKKRYAYKNLELFYQYKNFLEYINKGKGKNYFLDNKKFVKRLFDGVCIIGDSQVLRLERLKYLDREQTVSYGGTRIDVLTDKIEKGDEINIKKFDTIILWNGYNLKYINDGEDYVDEYKKLIDAIHKKNSNCNIYICSLLPAEESAVAADIADGSPHNLYKGKEFDDALINAFGENYIDTKPFVHKNYDIDGTHMLESFYREAVPYMGFYTKFMKIKRETFVPENHLTEEDIEQRIGKELYMTFDDGPDKYTEQLLDILKKKEVKATFFVTYQNPKYIQNLYRMHNEGHSIGVHTYSHDFRIYGSEEEYFKDLFKMECEIYKVTGAFSNIIRFPGGSGNTSSKEYNTGIMERLVNLVQDLGYTYYDWNVSSGDGGHISSEKTLKNAIDGITVPKEKHVVLFHDPKEETIAIIADFIDYAKEKGYIILPLKSNSFICHFNPVN